MRIGMLNKANTLIVSTLQHQQPGRSSLQALVFIIIKYIRLAPHNAGAAHAAASQCTAGGMPIADSHICAGSHAAVKF